MLRLRVMSSVFLAIALVLTSVLPARAADLVGQQIDRAKQTLEKTSFWKTALGAGLGAWVGTKLVEWEPALEATSKVAAVTPFGSVVARAMVPLALGAFTAQVAGKGFRDADYTLAGAQTIGGAVGTALALVVAPATGWMAPLVGDLLGSYAATKILQGLRKPKLAHGVFGVGGGDAPLASKAASGPVQVPELSSPSLAALSPHARDAYSHWVAANKDGDQAGAKKAYAEYLAETAQAH